MSARRPTFTLGSTSTSLLGLTLVSLSIYAVLWTLDHLHVRPWPWPWDALWGPASADALAGAAEVTVGILGVAITVVSIIVELAATRYTQRIAELFLRDRTNLLVLSFFVITAVLTVWINVTLGEGPVPRWMVFAELVMISGSLLALLPYFAYVFAFLSPTHVVQRIGAEGIAALQRASRGGDLEAEREIVLRSLDQLGDICLKALQNQDKAIAISTIHRLADVVTASLGLKDQLPDAWFQVYERLKTDADFVSFHRDVVRRLEPRHTWVEMKALRQYQAAFAETVLDQRDIGHLIAIEARRVAVRAAEAGDRPALRLVVRFLNTFTRASINARDVRSAYNLMNEYRLLGQGLLGTDLQAELLPLAGHIKTYGQLGFKFKLGFILETAAYDLCSLLEKVHEAGAPEHDGVLAVFLDVDREPDQSEAQELALRGVRKAQVKLATFYLQAGEPERARRIHRDMRLETPERLSSIRDELVGTVEEEFWEIADRAANFDWLPPERRALVGEFFSWFPPSHGA